MPSPRYLSVKDLTAPRTLEVLQLAARLKCEVQAGTPHPRLAGKTLAMIFQKPSLRTRVSFEVGTFQQYGTAAQARAAIRNATK